MPHATKRQCIDLIDSPASAVSLGSTVIDENDEDVVVSSLATSQPQPATVHDDVDSLGIAALKELIATAGLGTEDCIEISDLRTRAREARAAATISPAPPSAPPEDDDDEVAFCGERSWEERDAELRAKAVDLEMEPSPLPPARPAASAPGGSSLPKQGNAAAPVDRLSRIAEERRRLVRGALGDVSADVKPDVTPSKAAAEPSAPAAGGSSSAPPAPATLNAEQQRAVDLARGGESIFLTGGAGTCTSLAIAVAPRGTPSPPHTCRRAHASGTGKSLTLNRVISALKEKHGHEAVYVTASTGIAATVIGGTTLHSFAGIGVGKGSVDEIFAKMSRFTAERWQKCYVLVIDEVCLSAPASFHGLPSPSVAFHGLLSASVAFCGLPSPPVTSRGLPSPPVLSARDR